MFKQRFALSVLAACSVALSISPAAATTALTNTTVDLHSGPGAKFMTIGDVSANAKVGILWCGGADFAWCLIQFHNKQGWVSLSDLTGFGTAGLKPGFGGPGSHAATVAGHAAASIGPEQAEPASRADPHVGATNVGSSGVHGVGLGL